MSPVQVLPVWANRNLYSIQSSFQYFIPNYITSILKLAAPL